jgi:hypothetical protein
MKCEHLPMVLGIFVPKEMIHQEPMLLKYRGNLLW